MSTKRILFNSIILVAIALSLVSGPALAAPLPTPTLQGTTATLPVVAIHISELMGVSTNTATLIVDAREVRLPLILRE